MATGYTSGVSDGKVTEFKEFAQHCARAFGAAILMRDEPGGPIDIDKCMDTSGIKHHEESLVEAIEATKKTDEQILAGFDKYVADNIKNAEESIANTKATIVRYKAMLDKVNAWQPPTSDHVKFKEFMVQQLTESIEYDDYTKYSHETIATMKALTPERHLELKRESLNDSVKYHTKHLAENKERNTDRRDWLVALVDALEELETA